VKCKYRRALTYYDLTQYHDCISDCLSVLSYDNHHVPTRLLIGKAYKVIFEYSQAEEQLTLAIKSDGELPGLFSGNTIFDIRYYIL
jgi:hypothetical protein